MIVWGGSLITEDKIEIKILIVSRLYSIKFLFWAALAMVLWALLPAYIACAQNKKADSLKALLPAVHDTLKIEIMRDLAWQLRNNEAYIAYDYIQQARKFAEKLSKRSLLPNIWNYEGVILRNLGNYPAALQCYYIAVKIAEEQKNEEDLAYAYNNIGDIHKLQGNFEEAASYCSKASVIFEKLDNWKGIGYANARLGELYEENGKYDLAKAAYEKVLKVRTGKVEATSLTYPLSRIGFMMHKLGDDKGAIEYLNKALQIGFDVSSKRSQSTTLNDLAQMYQNRKELQKSNDYAIKSLESAEASHHFEGARAAAKILTVNYKALGDFKNAYKYQEKFVAYTDTLFNEDRSRSLVAIFNNFEIYKREQENELLKKDQLLQKEQNKGQRYVIMAVLGLVLGLLVAVFFIARANRKRKKVNQRLVSQNETIAAQNNELERQAENLALANTTIGQINDNITASINYTKRIQGAILPTHDTLSEHLSEYFIFYRPKDIVSGDFYWFETVGSKLILIAGDCTGHGVPGAFMSMLCGGALIDAVLQKNLTDPAKILKEVDRSIHFILKQRITNNQDGMDAAVCVYDTETRNLDFCGAKSSLLLFQKGQRTLLRADRHSIGGYENSSTKPKNSKAFVTQSFSLSQATTTFYMSTDGYRDQIGGPNRRKLMSKPFYDMLEEIHTLPMQEQHQYIENFINGWINNSAEMQMDDMLIWGVRI